MIYPRITRVNALENKWLTALNYEEEAAKYFMKYCQEHGDRDIDTLHMRIVPYEQKNLDKPRRYLLEIYELITEPDDMFSARVEAIENIEIQKCLKQIEYRLEGLADYVLQGTREETNIRAYEVLLKFAQERLEFYKKIATPEGSRHDSCISIKA